MVRKEQFSTSPRLLSNVIKHPCVLESLIDINFVGWSMRRPKVYWIVTIQHLWGRRSDACFVCWRFRKKPLILQHDNVVRVLVCAVYEGFNLYCQCKAEQLEVLIGSGWNAKLQHDVADL